MSDQTRYPLSWPAGRARTPAGRRGTPKFDTGSFAEARDFLYAELRRLGASNVNLSTNLRLGHNGIAYSGQRKPEDTGVAVYFTRNKRELAMACDLWRKVEENAEAIARFIEAQRCQERWVGSAFIDAVFAGFEALPASSGQQPWYVVLGVDGQASNDEVKNTYRRISVQNHPDLGGDTSKMAAINNAYQQFKTERGIS